MGESGRSCGLDTERKPTISLRLAIVQDGEIVAAEPGDRPPSLHYLAFAILMLTKLIHSTGQG
jgi:hypothetical protein